MRNIALILTIVSLIALLFASIKSNGIIMPKTPKHPNDAVYINKVESKTTVVIQRADQQDDAQNPEN